MEAPAPTVVKWQCRSGRTVTGPRPAHWDQMSWRVRERWALALVAERHAQALAAVEDAKRRKGSTLAAVLRLTELGQGMSAVADELGIKPESVDRLLRKNDRRDVIARLRRQNRD